MERESFEDDEVAALLNAGFVAIKVDREERPDLDHIYMSVCQALTGQGGWPLTVVLTPEKQPFFAGTYYPKQNRYGRPGLVELLPRLVKIWNEDRERAVQAGEDLVRRLSSAQSGKALGDGTLTGQERDAKRDEDAMQLVDRAARQFGRQYDHTYGGFGDAPKFPAPHNLSFLLHYAAMAKDPAASEMALHTLVRMFQGGIWDHVGHGFARYSTDAKWLVPHFEKMLYDNALLAHAYLDAMASSGQRWFGEVAEKVFAFVETEMTSSDGAFYSALDADSEGEEGKYYLFTEEELTDILGSEDGPWFCRMYGVHAGGNFEGQSILNLLNPPQASWSPLEVANTPDQISQRERLESCRARVYAERAKRIAPSLDDKVLTAWNALMIGALAKGSRILRRPDLLARAERARAFIERELRDAYGRLQARWRAGEARYLAYLDDYAYLVWADLELYDATGDPRHLGRAQEMVEAAVRLFADTEGGGFFFAGADGETLLFRPKEFYDGAMPSGNSVMASVMARLVALTDDEALRRQADRQLAACLGRAVDYPMGHAHLLMAALQHATPPISVVLVAEFATDPQLSGLQEVLAEFNWPSLASHVKTRESSPMLEQLAPYTASHPFADQATAYVCEGFACRAPVTTPEALAQQLRAARRNALSVLPERDPT